MKLNKKLRTNKPFSRAEILLLALITFRFYDTDSMDYENMLLNAGALA